MRDRPPRISRSPSSGRAARGPVGSSGLRLRLAALRVPIALEIRDQGRAEVAIGLLARIDRAVRTEGVERLLAYAECAPVARRAHDPRSGQPRHHALDCRIHGVGLYDLVADEPSFRAVAFDPALILNSLSRDTVSGEARHPHVCGAGNDALL